MGRKTGPNRNLGHLMSVVVAAVVAAVVVVDVVVVDCVFCVVCGVSAPRGALWLTT